MGKVKELLNTHEYSETLSDITLTDIAINKAWCYAMEYDSTSGRAVEKQGFNYIRDGYTQGFLDGITYRFGGEND